jgi:integrase
MRMNRPPSAALPDLTGPPVTASPWRWSAAEPEPSGRLLLPTAARRVLGVDGDRSRTVSGVVRGDTLVLRPHQAGGRAMTIDGRGRIYLPVRLRRHPGIVIGSHTDPDDPVVVIVPAAWIDEIVPTFGASTAATYRPYWRLAAGLLGDRCLAELITTDLAGVVDAAAERARRHRPESTGWASRQTCIAARRALYARAVDAGHLAMNPAAALRKPLRATSRRRALADAIRASSTDPDLDLLLLRFHLETGARRQGALNLRLRDIDTNRATVWLREENDSEREQPASPSVVAVLLAHSAERGGHDVDDTVFRNRHGEPVSGRRYDRLFARARGCLGWDDRTPVSAHVLRHTAITRIGRIAGHVGA